MSSFNEISYFLTCPRCGNKANMDIDLYFGFRNQISYKIGDTYAWVPRKMVKNGGRPMNGELDGEGYTVCPICDKDFFVLVEVRDDKITNILPDLSKKPYVPD